MAYETCLRNVMTPIKHDPSTLISTASDMSTPATDTDDTGDVTARS